MGGGSNWETWEQTASNVSNWNNQYSKATPELIECGVLQNEAKTA